MMRLIFHSGSRAGNEINTAAPVIRIGRHPEENDLVIDDNMASSAHARLTRSPKGTYILEDVGSTNGTFVNGQRISKVSLSSGDRFGIGATEVEVGEGLPRLMATTGPLTGRDLPLGSDAITIGRAPDNTFDIDDEQLSAYHAAILPLAEGFVLQDNGSTNGTLHNGDKVDRAVLLDGDTINVGQTELRFLIDDIDDEKERRRGDEAPGAKLVFVAGPHENVAIPLGPEQVVLGRRPDCTFPVSDLQVSGTHVAFTIADGKVHAVDLQSSNGTFVNGKRISPSATLAAGDLIEFGECVAELRVTGGVAEGTDPGASVFTSVEAEGAYEVTAQPKFVINGEVSSTDRIELGRSPSCAVLLDSDTVSRVHAEIVWRDDGFFILDRSSFGTYVSDKRVVDERLQTGHVIKIGPHVLNVDIRGERCTLEEIDRAAAMAAIEVAKELSATGGSMPGGGYKTLHKLDVPSTEALVRERKAKFKEGAPAWRPSTDIKGDPLRLIAVVSAVLMSLLGAGALYAATGDSALLNHPLSEAHSSKEFVAWAEKRGMDTGCGACHSVGDTVDDDKCVQCHDGYRNDNRPRHLEPSADVRADQVSPGSDCASCHNEHRGSPRMADDGSLPHLGAAESCASDTCHPNQHSADFLREGPEPPAIVAAGPVPTFDMDQAPFHAAHAVVEHNGEALEIACQACHAAKDGSGGLVEAAPGKSCFRCHEGGEQFVNSQCMACHNDEHVASGLDRLPAGDPMIAAAAPAPRAATSLVTGGALTLVAFLPLIGVGLARRARRQQRSEAIVQELLEMPAEVLKRLVHSINVDKCVGCGLCVQACPGSVLELVHHKSVVVNFDSCIQCKKCEQACAFDALRMHDADKPPPMIQMPEVDNYYQTPVAGMYLIGQASGTPQVKNAINLGHAVVEHMAREGVAPGIGQAAGAQYDVVIIGSGPAGLSAAISCASAGLSYVLLEKQRDFSWTIRSYYHKGKEVMAEPNQIDMVGLLPHWDTDREQLLGAWQEKIHEHGIDIQYEQDVTGVEKRGEAFAVTTSDGKGQPKAEWTGARVILAIGTMGNPRKLGCPGDDMAKVHNALVDPDEYRDRNILVVGGTDSAIEVVLALCNSNKVWMSMRRAKFDRVKPANLKKIEAAIEAGKVTLVAPTVVKEVTDSQVRLENREDKTPIELPNDVIFAMIGGHPPIKWLQSIGVPYVEKPHSWSPPRTDDLARGSV